MAQIIDGRAMARALSDETAARVAAIVAQTGQPPALAVVLVGDDPASQVYVRRKISECARVGIRSVEHRLPVDHPQDALLMLIDQLNGDPAIHGILIQLPLPPHIDAALVLDRIDPAKDVDGFHPVNVGRLSTGTGGLVPCTPLGIMRLLDSVIDDYRGLNAVVIGKSNIVGKPVAMLLLEREATVTVTHIYWVKPGAIVIDVGINRIAQPDGSSQIVGDCATQELDHAKAVTPVPGGVGPMTIACLLHNTVLAAERAKA